MFDIGFGAAFIAGLLSFISPCVLPIVPPYLAYLAGIGLGESDGADLSGDRARRLIVTAIAFVLGFTTVFVALGATASMIGQAIAQHFALLSVVAGAIIIVMGLHFLGVLRISLLYREARLGAAMRPSGAGGAYVMGLAFAFGWTPCVGPVLAAILFIAGAEETAMRGAALLAAYSLGIGLPFILAAVFMGRFVGLANRFKRHLPWVERAMGLLLIATGILFMTGQMSRIAQWLLETFPVFATIG
ncbi:cytochrome c biogenesis CcdA family protein [Oricola sp.]|uniref:cytochrome c biogenesis CcdA family protein n=1 Tax=Oricola sp. TaxID=1979950 RepID=UPI003BAC152D